MTTEAFLTALEPTEYSTHSEKDLSLNYRELFLLCKQIGFKEKRDGLEFSSTHRLSSFEEKKKTQKLCCFFGVHPCPSADPFLQGKAPEDTESTAALQVAAASGAGI